MADADIRFKIDGDASGLVDATKTGAKAVVGLAGSLKTMDKSVKESAKVMRTTLDDASKKAAKSVLGLADSMTSITASGATLARGMRLVSSAFFAVAARVTLANAAFAVSAAAMAALAVVATAVFVPAMIAAGTAMFNLAVFTSDYVDQVSLLSTRTGLAADTLIGLDFAAQASGKSIEELEEGLAGFAARVGEASRSLEGPGAKAFKDIGVEITDTTGRVRDLDDILRESLDAIGRLPTATQRATAAFVVFGESGTKTVAALGGSSAALDEWTEKARVAGIVMDEGLVQASQDMDVAFAELDLAITAVKLNLGESYVPAVATAVELTADFVTGLGFMVKILSDAALDIANVAETVRLYNFLTGKAVEATEEFADATEVAFALAAEQAEILAAQRADAVKADFAAAAVRERLAEEAEKRAEEATKAAIDRARRVSAVLRQIAESSVATNADVDERVASSQEQQAAFQLERITTEQTALEEAAARRIEDAELQAEMIAEAHKLALQQIEERREAQLGLAETVVAGAEMGFGTIVGLLSQVEGAFDVTKKAAVALFRAQQAAAVGQIAIDTFRNIVALTPPPPLGLGPFAGPAFAIAQGGAAATSVLAQKLPSFHIGGVVPEDAPRLPGGGPRDRLAIVEPGEEITPEGRGRQPTIVNVIQLGNRLFEAATMRSIAGGALASLGEPETMGQSRFVGAR